MTNTYKPDIQLRLLMVVNKAEREYDVLRCIAHELLSTVMNLDVNIIEYRDKNFFAKSLNFEPNIILTFPFTSKGLSIPFYALKLALDCHIATLQSEGIINYRDESCYKYYAGMDNYGDDLIDLQMMWSRLLAQKIGGILLNSSRISSMERMVSVGHPKLGGYLGGVDLAQSHTPATEDFLCRVAACPRERVLFFATGFSLGEYSVSDLLNARDIFDSETPDQAQLDEAQNAIEASRMFRGLFIKAVDGMASRHPEALFAIKSHPVENVIFKRTGNNPYRPLLRHANVAYYDEPMSIKTVLVHSGAFFHFGSSIVAESYLAGTPSVFIESAALFPHDRMPRNPNFQMHNMGWPSTCVCDIEELREFVDAHVNRPLAFSLDRTMLDKLEDGFDVLPEHLDGRKAYQPIRRIASAIARLHHSPALKCRVNDPGLLRHLTLHYLPAIMSYLGAAVERCAKTGQEDKALRYIGKVKELRELVARQA